jgi:hypothetical protein
MIRPKNLALVTARRTLRAKYAQTQGTPYAAVLRAASGSNWNDSTKNQSNQAAFGQASNVASVFPGAVMSLATQLAAPVAGAGETVDLAGVNEVPFGLSANFIGGDMDEIVGAGNTEVGVWRGSGSVWIVLAPVFTGTINDGDSVQAAARGQIKAGSTQPIGICIDNLGANAISVDLRIP